MKDDKLGNIQALRGVACLLVVLFHTAQLESSFGLQFSLLRPTLRFGYAGVDLFFTLSGFVLAYVHRDWFGQRGRVLPFLFRRLWRIYPTYWVVLLLAIAWLMFLDSSNPLAPELADITWRAIVLAPGGYACQPWVPQAWTLSHELAFYATFAALLVLPRWAAAVALFGWLIAVVALRVGFPSPTNCFAALWTSPFVIEFLLGSAVGWCLRPGWGRWSRRLLAAAALWLSAGLAWAYDPDPIRLGGVYGLRMLIWAVPSALLVAALAGADLAGRWRLSAWLPKVGEASYSIYLVHILTQAMVFWVWIALGIGHHRAAHVAWVLTTVGSAIGAGFLLHQFAERPLLKVWRSGKRVTAPIVTSAFVVEVRDRGTESVVRRSRGGLPMSEASRERQ